MLNIFSGGKMDAVAKAPVDLGPVGSAVADTNPAGSTAIRSASSSIDSSSAKAPNWLVSQMPPGYQTRFAEIQRLSEEIQGMDRLGRLLWDTGPALREAIRQVFIALKFEVEPAVASAGRITVKVDAKRRLLLHLSESDRTIEKKDDDVKQVFHMLHEVAGEGDRVVFVSNANRTIAPTSRPPAITPEALAFISRMGANFTTTPTLFAVWNLSMQDPNRARAQVERLHGQDGGTFVVTS
jgi:hypothetical protein